MPDLTPVEAPTIARAPTVTPSLPTQEATAPAETPRSIIRQYQVVEGGSTTTEVVIDEKTRYYTADLITRRLQALTKMQEDEVELTAIDSIILAQGQGLTDRLESDQITVDDFFLARTIIRDELIQKSVATARLAKDKPGWLNRVKGIPIIGRLADPPESELESIGFATTSAYLEEIGFSRWGERRINDEIVDLNNARRTFELSMFPKGFRDPLYDDISSSNFTDKTGDRFNDEIVSQLGKLVGERFTGRTFEDIWTNNPSDAINLLLEANQRALTSIASKTAKEILLSDKPTADPEVIEDYAKKLDQPEPEAAQQTERGLVDAQEAVTQAKAELTRLTNELVALKTALPEKQRALSLSEARMTHDLPNANALVTHHDNERVRIANDISALIINPALPVEQEALRIERETTRLQTERGIVSERYVEATASRDNIIREYRAAEKDEETCRNRIQQLEGTLVAPAGAPPLESITIAKANYEREIKSLTAKERKKRLKVEGKSGGTTERKDKATGLRTWGKLVKAENYEKIIDARFNQGPKGEFTTVSLTDKSILPEDQVAGAEKIREHILRLIEGVDYNPKLARKMLSDETIALAIVSTYNLNGVLSTELTAFLPAKHALEAARRAIPPNPAAISAAETTLKVSTRTLLESAFSEMAAGNRAQVGATIEFIIQQGLISAQKGEPYLQIEERFIR